MRRLVLMLAISNAALALAAAAGCDDAADPRPMDGPPLGGNDGAEPEIDSGPSPPAPDATVTPAPDASADAMVDAGDGSGDASSDAAADDAAMPAVPETLAETGLYEPGSTSALAAGVLAFAPRYQLWSDGAEKQRWLLLPEGAQIDTSDMDAWSFPLGTKVWKEFARDGRRLETRLIWKTDEGWQRVAYLWNEDDTAAVAAPRGADDVLGTDHDVPQRTACGECHDGQPDFALGLSAIELAHDGPGVTLASLVADGRLSDPPSGELALPDSEEWNALGYLHANCGSCHTPSSIVWDKVDLDLWLRTAELGSAQGTRAYQSSVGAALTDTGGSLTLRIAPGDPAASGLIFRMNVRGDDTAMPPLASEHVDEDGVALISSWIESL